MEETVTEDKQSSSSTVPSIQELKQGSDGSRSGGRSLTPQECEDRFGLEVYRSGMDVQIQRLVNSQGPAQVKQWADEGMTVDTMGKPQDMAAFRERNQSRPAEVPRDIERRNQKSVQRSRGAHQEASHAGDTQVPDSVREVISSSGQSLDTSIQREMEERMGESFDDVRVHTDSKAAKACQDINAKAFTVGNHIVFNHGEYNPGSSEGQHLLAHELAHVRQQTGGAISMLPQDGLHLEIDPDPQLERDAEETAQRVMRGGKLGIPKVGSDLHVQRSKDKPNDKAGTQCGEGTVVSIDFPDRQLQKKFKHAKRFGVSGNWKEENKEKFEQALRDHINNSNTERVEGTYRGEDVIHFYNPETQNNVILTKDGKFLSGWTLSNKQKQHLTQSGDL